MQFIEYMIKYIQGRSDVSALSTQEKFVQMSAYSPIA